MIDSSIREDLKAYLDGELPIERAAEVEAAIAQHPELEEEMKFYQALSFGIRDIANPVEVVGRAETLDRFKQSHSGFSWKRFGQLVLVTLCVGLVASALYPVFGTARSAASAGKRAGRSAAPLESAQSPGSSPFSDAASGSESMSPSAMPDSEVGMRSGRSTDQNAKSPAYSSPVPQKSEATPEVKVNVPSGNSSPAVSRKVDSTRMVIHNARLHVRVESTQKAMETLTTRTEKLGGYVASSSTQGDPKVQLTADLVLKVPSKHFDSFMTDLRKMGDVLSTQSQGDDVTLDYTDMQARLKVMQAERDSLTKMLSQRSNMDEVVTLRQRIMDLQAQIDSLFAQASALKSQASMATIHVNLTEPAKERENSLQAVVPPSDPFATTWNSSVAGMVGALQNVGKLGIVLVVYAPVWIPICVLVWLAYRNRHRLA